MESFSAISDYTQQTMQISKTDVDCWNFRNKEKRYKSLEDLSHQAQELKMGY